MVKTLLSESVLGFCRIFYHKKEFLRLNKEKCTDTMCPCVEDTLFCYFRSVMTQNKRVRTRTASRLCLSVVTVFTGCLDASVLLENKSGNVRARVAHRRCRLSLIDFLPPTRGSHLTVKEKFVRELLTAGAEDKET